MMENPEHPESESPEPVRPEFLEYRGKGSARADRPPITGGQIAAGFGCWILSLGGAYGAACVAYGLGITSQFAWGGVIGWLAVLVPCSVYFAGRLRWRGFGPGVVIGAALTCLVPAGILAVLCSSR